jgi:Asp/Glu/hydantoin racemase
LYKSDFVRAALRAEAEGYDAFFISVILDPALEEIRSLLKIPVVGLFQSTMLFAATLGQPISWVLYAPAAEEQLPRLASLYGVRDLMGPIIRPSFTLADVMAGYKDPTRVIEMFTEAGERAVAQGAKVLVPGEARLNTLMARAGVSEVAGVPVIDSIGVGIAYAEMRARFYRRTGLTHAQSGFYYATPPRALVDGLQEQYFGTREPGRT